MSALPGNADDGEDLGIVSRTEDDPAAVIDGSVPVGRRHAYTPKYPPAVKAMPACRPSGLPYER